MMSSIAETEKVAASVESLYYIDESGYSQRTKGMFKMLCNIMRQPIFTNIKIGIEMRMIISNKAIVEEKVSREVETFLTGTY